jgi:DhnA family fructose-bisphosphate aldolase class Ia
MDMGKYRRLQNIFREDGKTTIVAMDHGATSGPIEGIIKPSNALIECVNGHADAILTSIGIAKNFKKELARTGLIIRLDFPSSDLVPGVRDCELLVEVEEAVKIGADAVIITAGPGVGVERATMKNLTRVGRECERYGMAFIAEMYPGGFNPPAEMLTIETLKLSARMACEWGADMIKMPYRPGFEAVVEGSYLPIVVLGGAKTNSQEEFMMNIYDAIQSGAKGVAIGRNVWGHNDTTNVVKTLNAIIHENADVLTAMSYLKQEKRETAI